MRKEPTKKLQIKHGGSTYVIDSADLDGREMGVVGKLVEELGQGTGSLYGLLLVAKRRAGETVTVDEILDLKIGDIDPEEITDARPPGGRASSAGK